MFKASSIVSGNFCPVVSGKRKARHPDRVAKEPMMTIGNGFQTRFKEPIRSDRIPEKN
jgi:hypothetical protein